MDYLRKYIDKPFGVISVCLILAILSSYPFVLVYQSLKLPTNGVTPLVTLSLSGFLFMFLIPALIIKRVWGKNLSDFGFKLPQNGLKKAEIFLITLTILLALYFLLKQASIQNYYSLYWQKMSASLIIFNLTAFLYYLSEEFLFRGFLLFSLWEKVKLNSILISAIIFSLLHLTRPLPEIFFAFFYSIVMGYVSIKTKSFLPSALLHFILSVLVNFAVVI